MLDARGTLKALKVVNVAGACIMGKSLNRYGNGLDTEPVTTLVFEADAEVATVATAVVFCWVFTVQSDEHCSHVCSAVSRHCINVIKNFENMTLGLRNIKIITRSVIRLPGQVLIILECYGLSE